MQNNHLDRIPQYLYVIHYQLHLQCVVYDCCYDKWVIFYQLL